MFKTNWQKNIAVILIFSTGILFFIILTWKKIEFHEKCEKNTFNQCGKLMQIILVKLTWYVTEKYKKKKKNK